MIILCRFNLFAMDQRIYALNETTGETNDLGSGNLFDIANLMIDAANSPDYKTNKFHLYGPTQYAEMISKQIKQNSASKYNNNNIEVEIN